MSYVAFASVDGVLPGVAGYVVWSYAHNARLTEGGRQVVVRTFGEGLAALERAGLLPSETDHPRSAFVAPVPESERAR